MHDPNCKRFTSNSEKAVLLKEAHLKCAFLEHLRRLGRLNASSVLASEFALGGAGRRIDLAIWSGEFVGVEFKSKFDTLRRLSWQLEAYLKCFDRVVFVVDQKHASKVAALLPAQVELWVVEPTGNFVLKSAAGVLRGQTTEALANLCTLARLRQLSNAGRSDGAYRGRRSVLASGLKLEDVYESAVARFRKNFAASSRAFWDAVGDQAIHQDALPSLSRFTKQRTRLASIQEAEENFWRDWVMPISNSAGTPTEPMF
ncbi:sce7726 family protein [Bradyrhizobium sp. USDA 336]|uniref:sce7726 family protein n=1 Tax=Bradyrhizobium sp. USDA 336 TaxID=3156311 RepID=UPI0038343567